MNDDGPELAEEKKLTEEEFSLRFTVLGAKLKLTGEWPWELSDDVQAVNHAESLDRLRVYLQSTPEGPLDAAVARAMFELLANAWEDLHASVVEVLSLDQLSHYHLIEWEPPVVSVSLERQRVNVMGAKATEVQGWSINVETGVVVGWQSHRFDGQPRLHMKPLVDELVRAIGAHAEDPRQWNKDGTVSIRIGSALRGNSKQTVQRRGRRFRQVLDPALEAIGWTKVPGPVNWYWYRQKPT